MSKRPFLNSTTHTHPDVWNGQAHEFNKKLHIVAVILKLSKIEGPHIQVLDGAGQNHPPQVPSTTRLVPGRTPTNQEPLAQGSKVGHQRALGEEAEGGRITHEESMIPEPRRMWHGILTPCLAIRHRPHAGIHGPNHARGTLSLHRLQVCRDETNDIMPILRSTRGRNHWTLPPPLPPVWRPGIETPVYTSSNRRPYQWDEWPGPSCCNVGPIILHHQWGWDTLPGGRGTASHLRDAQPASNNRWKRLYVQVGDREG